MVVASRTVTDAYQDSVKLMRVASDVSDAYDVEEALAVMATDENKAMVSDTGLLGETELADLGPNDLLLVVAATEEDAATAAVEDMVDSIRGSRATSGDRDTGSAPPPQSLYSAVEQLPEANLALISIPGEYAAREAWKALHRGLNVHVFSDNVDLDDERALKEAAQDTDRLVMGPDCGTAIINGVPLGFANEVDRGSVGVVAASGTGLQEVTTLVDRAGAGVSQAIGTGGRDLSAAVGGLTMHQGIERLSADSSTDVIVLLSKPPAPDTLAPLLETIEACQKPVIVNFIDADEPSLESAGAIESETLEEAARLAIESTSEATGQVRFDAGVDGFTDPDDAAGIVNALDAPMPGRVDVRGLFTGGTFAHEAVMVLEDYLDDIASNVSAGTTIADPLEPNGHAVVDLGADTFTRGRPHPMIDPALRTEQLESALNSDSVRIVLLDVVLGYGAHDDPAGPIAEVLADSSADDDWPIVVASVCGTRGDPQDWPTQIERLVQAGVYVTESNAAAAQLAGEIWSAAETPGSDQL